MRLSFIRFTIPVGWRPSDFIPTWEAHETHQCMTAKSDGISHLHQGTKAWGRRERCPYDTNFSGSGDSRVYCRQKCSEKRTWGSLLQHDTEIREVTRCMILFIWNGQNWQITETKSSLAAARLGKGGGMGSDCPGIRGFFWQGDKNGLELDSGDGYRSLWIY